MLPDKRQVRFAEQFVPSLYSVIGQTASSIEQFVPRLCSVISQTASSIWRTVCTPAYALLSVKRQVRSKRTVCTLPHDVVIIQQASSIQRNGLYQPFCLCLRPNSQFNPKEQFVSVYLFVFSTKWQVRSKEQLVSAYVLMFPVKCQVQSQEQLAPISCFVSLGQVTSSTQRAACTLFSIPGLSTLSMSTWIPSDMIGSIDSSRSSCIHNQIFHSIHNFENLKTYFYVQKQCKC
jgi:hypothetical protein